MKQVRVDNYTKLILTVIAVCLTILTFKQIELFPSAIASENNPYVGEESVNYGIIPINEDGTISVKLTSMDEIDVNIVGIETSDELDINIDEIGGSYVSHGGPIPVKVK